MSLYGVIKQYIAGQATLQDVDNKIKAVAESGALDVLQAGEQMAVTFWNAFAPAEAKSLTTDTGTVIAAVASGTGVSAALAAVAPTVLTQTEQNAEAAGGTVASAEVNNINAGTATGATNTGSGS